MEKCPCNPAKNYSECCQPLHQGKSRALTAEQLMRSRYSAYVKGEVDYIYETLLPENREEGDKESIRSWSANSTWLGLEILNTVKGLESDSEGGVEFIARFSDGKKEIEHHENAVFKKVDGRWFFEDGYEVKAQPLIHEQPKPGRNDNCPCGSGKKYKKCCGK